MLYNIGLFSSIYLLFLRHEFKVNIGEYFNDLEVRKTFLKTFFVIIKDIQIGKVHVQDFSSGPAAKNPPSNAGDMGLIPG